MRKISLAIILAGASATPALSQSTDASGFSGPRVEALVGYDMLRSGDDDNQELDEQGGTDSIDGLTYGLGVGFDFDLGGIVAGIEGEFGDSTGKQKEEDSLGGFDVAAGLSVGRDLYVGGRIGIKAGASTLLYAKGGYTNTRVNAFTEIDGERFSDHANASGFRVGAGVEQLFGSNAYGKLEYRYSRYSKLKFGDELAGEIGQDSGSNIDLDRHQVVAAFGFRF